MNDHQDINQRNQTISQTNLVQEIDYEHFIALDIRIAKVIMAQEIEGADKLLKITLDVGELGERTVAAGIKTWYKPEDLIGRQVVYLSNLSPRHLRGVVSQGMILAATDDEVVLLSPEKQVSPGAKIS